MYLKITPEEIKLIQEQIGTTNEPIRVTVKFEHGCLPDYCFPNVLDKVKKKGGRMILGRKLLKTTYLIEAEHHAVYMSPKGEIIDITPQHFPVIQFIPTPDLEYKGETLDTVLVNHTSNPIVDDYIKMENTLMKFKNMGSLKGVTGNIRLTEDEGRRYTVLTKTKTALIDFLSSNTLKSKCFCGTNLSYEDCHHKNLDLLISEILNEG